MGFGAWLARQLFRGPCEGALHPSQGEALADSLATWPLQWRDRTMRQYSDSERSSAAASLARSCQRLGGTRSFSSSVFFSASGGMVDLRKKIPTRASAATGRGNRTSGETTPGGGSKRVALPRGQVCWPRYQRGFVRPTVGGERIHDRTHCTRWRAIHRAHQAAAMEMVTGEVMRRTVLARAGQDGAPASAWRSSRRDAARCARWGL